LHFDLRTRYPMDGNAQLRCFTPVLQTLLYAHIEELRNEP